MLLPELLGQRAAGETEGLAPAERHCWEVWPSLSFRRAASLTLWFCSKDIYVHVDFPCLRQGSSEVEKLNLLI